MQVRKIFRIARMRIRNCQATIRLPREIIDGQEPMVAADPKKKPLSIAVDEVYHGKVKIVGADED